MEMTGAHHGPSSLSQPSGVTLSLLEKCTGHTFASSLSLFLLQHLEDSRIGQVWSCQLMEVNSEGNEAHKNY